MDARRTQHERVRLALLSLAESLQHILSMDGAIAVLWLLLVLVGGAAGVPIPEEAVLATAGFLAARDRVPALPTFAACWATLWVLDALTYEVGRRLGPRARRSWMGQRIARRRWAWMRLHMRRHGVKTVAGARFVMGSRIATFLAAGAAHMPRSRFWATTGLAGLVSGGIPFVLGWWLADSLPAVLEGLRVGRWVILGVLLLAFAAWIVWWKRKETQP